MRNTFLLSVVVTMWCLVCGDLVVIPTLLGSTVTITCRLPMSDTFVWEDSDGIILSFNGQVQVSNKNSSKYLIERQIGVHESLVIFGVTLAEDKDYTCFDYINNKDIKSISRVHVLVEPHYVNVTLPTMPLNEETEQIFVCMADGGKPLPRISWVLYDVNGNMREIPGMIQDYIYPNQTGKRTNLLRLRIKRDLYRARLQCIVALDIIYTESINISMDVNVLPTQPQITGYTGTYDVDQYFTVTCSSYGSRPTARMMWLLNGKVAGDSEIMIYTAPDGTSGIKGIFWHKLSRDYDGSNLTCAVTSSVVEAAGMLPFTDTITLFATYAPNVTVVDKRMVVHEGVNVSIKCLVRARPMPAGKSIIWFQNGQIIPQNFYMDTDSENGTRLNIMYIQRSDAGNYSCSASNRLGVGRSVEMELIVLYRPQCTEELQKVAVSLGKTVGLDCTMYANPNNVTTRWSYQQTHRLIRNETAKPIGQDIAYSRLDIVIDSTDKYGYVSCQGENSEGVGDHSCDFQIVPPGYPEAPTNCTISTDSTTDFDAIMACNPGFDGGSSQVFELQRSDGQSFMSMSNNTNPRFRLVSTPYGNITVRVCAWNMVHPDHKNCSDVVSILFNATVAVMAASVADDPNKTAYILGGVFSCLFLIGIGIVIIIFFTRRQRHAEKLYFLHGDLEPTNTSPNVTRLSSEVYIRNIPQTTVYKKRADVLIQENETPEPSRRNSASNSHLDENDTPPSIILASTPVYNFNIKVNQELPPVSPVTIDSGVGENNSSENTMEIGSFRNVDSFTYIDVVSKLAEFGSIDRGQQTLSDNIIYNGYVDMTMFEKKEEIGTLGEDSTTTCLYLDELIDHHGSLVSVATSQESSGCYSETDIAAVLDRSMGVQRNNASLKFIPNNRENTSDNDSRMTNVSDSRSVSNASHFMISNKPKRKMLIEGESIVIVGATTGESTKDNVKDGNRVIGDDKNARVEDSQMTVPDLSISTPSVHPVDLQVDVFINDDIGKEHRSSHYPEFLWSSKKTTTHVDDRTDNSNARNLTRSQPVKEENEENISRRKIYISDFHKWSYYTPDEKNITSVDSYCRDRKWSSSSSSSISSDKGGYTFSISRLMSLDQRKLCNNEDQSHDNSVLISRENNAEDSNDNFVPEADLSVQTELNAELREGKDDGLCTNERVHEQIKAEGGERSPDEVSFENTVKNNEYRTVVNLGKIFATDEEGAENVTRRRSYLDAMLDGYSAKTATEREDGSLECASLTSKEAVHSGTTESVLIKMFQPDSSEMFKIDNEAGNDVYGEGCSTLTGESAESTFTLRSSVSNSANSENKIDSESMSDRQYIEEDVDIIAYF